MLISPKNGDDVMPLLLKRTTNAVIKMLRSVSKTRLDEQLIAIGTSIQQGKSRSYCILEIHSIACASPPHLLLKIL